MVSTDVAAENSISQVPAGGNWLGGADESLDKIFAAVMVGGLDQSNPAEIEILKEKGPVFKQTLNRFLSTFRDNIFEDEYAVLYSALQTSNVKFFSSAQLDTILEHSSDEILGSNKVHLDKYAYLSDGGAATDDEKLTAFKFDVSSSTVKDPIWGNYIKYESLGNKCVYHWIEACIGIDAKIAGPLRLGWIARYRGRIHQSLPDVGEPWYVPGFGKKGSSRLGITFNVIFEL